MKLKRKISQSELEKLSKEVQDLYTKVGDEFVLDLDDTAFETLKAEKASLTRRKKKNVSVKRKNVLRKKQKKPTKKQKAIKMLKRSKSLGLKNTLNLKMIIMLYKKNITNM